MTSKQFEEFFTQLWGKEKIPFGWQKNLVERIMTNTAKPWPDAIALPTAAGKTACLDIAVFALAAQADFIQNGDNRTAPRRIFFVVDRRVIVDEAYERAKILAKKLQEAKMGILKEVADRLRQLARGECEGYGEENPLAVFELRGGMYRSEAWARSPLQPTIVTSTVDQIGSRLLFRAYGRSCKAWPILAGLVANDSLILLDEAHCSQPFFETLKAVQKYHTWAENPLQSIFQAVVMSATPPEGISDIFSDPSTEGKNPTHPLGKRQLAHKITELIPVSKAKGKNAWDELAKALAENANKIKSNERKAVVVFTNRVITARKTVKILEKKNPGQVVLLTGRMRPIDKDDTINHHLKELSADKSNLRKLTEPVFVVATQTLEVGANLDFDALVTECASLDAIRQRFGRLNRMGRDIPAMAAILIRADQMEESNEDPIYGSALANTWKWLNEQANEKKELDLGIAYLHPRLPDDEKLKKLNAPTMSAPVMLPSHVDCLVQTFPEPAPTPDVVLFLHGPQRGNADVQVCWRADINPEIDGEDSITSLLTICPPASAECLPVPISVFKKWMKRLVVEDETGDVEGTDIEIVDDISKEEKNLHKVVRWRGHNDVKLTEDPRDIIPGDVVVISTDAEDVEQLGDVPLSPMNKPYDWGDRAYLQTRAKALLRLHPAVINQWENFNGKSKLIELINTSEDKFNEDPNSLTAELHELLSKILADNFSIGFNSALKALITDRKLKKGLILHPMGGMIIRGSHLLNLSDEVDIFNDEDDTTSYGTGYVTLEKHNIGVASRAKRYATGCGLSNNLVDAIEKSGLLHDLGKADPRFQALLRGGNQWAYGELLAKSEDLPETRGEFEKARRTAGYPEHGRHELLSTRFAEKMTSMQPGDENMIELMLHLIESHHGRCRPFAPVIFDKNPVNVEIKFENISISHNSETQLELLDSRVSERFWYFTRHYGWWGLCWLEAILRLADHRQSEAEMMQ